MASGTETLNAPARGHIRVSRRALIRVLVAGTIALTVASICVALASDLSRHKGLLGLVHLFITQDEGNIPTWYSGILLFSCALAFAMVWSTTRQLGERLSGSWGVLAMVFALASLDEVAAIHDTLAGNLSGGGRNYFFYLAPGSVLLLGIGIYIRELVVRLPKSTRRALLLGLASWVLGAVALELAEGLMGDLGTLGSSILNSFQDLFEMLGAIGVLNAVLLHANDRRLQVIVESS